MDFSRIKESAICASLLLILLTLSRNVLGLDWIHLLLSYSLMFLFSSRREETSSNNTDVEIVTVEKAADDQICSLVDPLLQEFIQLTDLSKDTSGLFTPLLTETHGSDYECRVEQRTGHEFFYRSNSYF